MALAMVPWLQELYLIVVVAKSIVWLASFVGNKSLTLLKNMSSNSSNFTNLVSFEFQSHKPHGYYEEKVYWEEEVDFRYDYPNLAFEDNNLF
jgi:hypothetical protein